MWRCEVEVEREGGVVERIVQRSNHEPGVGMRKLREQEEQDANPNGSQDISQEA